jgi:hypothetical protein
MVVWAKPSAICFDGYRTLSIRKARSYLDPHPAQVRTQGSTFPARPVTTDAGGAARIHEDGAAAGGISGVPGGEEGVGLGGRPRQTRPGPGGGAPPAPGQGSRDGGRALRRTRPDERRGVALGRKEGLTDERGAGPLQGLVDPRADLGVILRERVGPVPPPAAVPGRRLPLEVCEDSERGRPLFRDPAGVADERPECGHDP